MFKKTMIGMVGICLMTLLWTEANARVCVLRSTSGTCKLWTGSLTCDIGATGLGNCENNQWTIGCSATGTGMWAVACGNPGVNTWTAPGVNVAEYSGTLSGAYSVQPTDCDSNGNAYLTIHMPTPENILNDLRSLACKNDNWTAIDAVPCHATATAAQYDANGCKVAEATLDCTIDCTNLRWDVAAQKFQVEQYSCTRTSLITYKTPVDCPTQ